MYVCDIMFMKSKLPGAYLCPDTYLYHTCIYIMFISVVCKPMYVHIVHVPGYFVMHID